VRTHGTESLSPLKATAANAIYSRLFYQHPAVAIGEKYGQVHHHDHQVLVPAIGLLAPEAGMPD
jgi:hypothetical protein